MPILVWVVVPPMCITIVLLQTQDEHCWGLFVVVVVMVIVAVDAPLLFVVGGIVKVAMMEVVTVVDNGRG